MHQWRVLNRAIVQVVLPVKNKMLTLIRKKVEIDNSRIDNSRTECVKDVKIYFIGLKKDLFGCFRIGEIRDKDNEIGLKEGGGIEISTTVLPLRDARSSSLCILLTDSREYTMDSFSLPHSRMKRSINCGIFGNILLGLNFAKATVAFNTASLPAQNRPVNALSKEPSKIKNRRTH